MRGGGGVACVLPQFLLPPLSEFVVSAPDLFFFICLLCCYVLSMSHPSQKNDFFSSLEFALFRCIFEETSASYLITNCHKCSLATSVS